MANFEAFQWNFSSSINLFFLKSDNKKKHIMADRFFKVVEIEAKNFGCVAIKEIPQGNLILQEQPQCVAQWSDPEYTLGGVNR